MRSRRNITISVLSAVVLFGTCGCVKVVSSYNVPTLRDFQWTMLYNTVSIPAASFSRLEMMAGDTIFNPGYHTEIGEKFKLTVDKVTDADSTWKVSGVVNRTDVALTVHMTGRDRNGFCEWAVTGSGFYDEGNGYTATLDLGIPAVFHWEKSISYSSVECSLFYDGKGCLKSFRYGTLLDTLEMSFSREAVVW